MEKVFVYGTLQRGFLNNVVMQNAGGLLIGQATTIENYPLVVDGLPYLYREQDGLGHKVKGELYHVMDMSPLDKLEGHPNFYEREKIDVKVETDTVAHIYQSWVYFINHDRLNPDQTLWESYREAVDETEGRWERRWREYAEAGSE